MIDITRIRKCIASASLLSLAACGGNAGNMPAVQLGTGAVAPASLHGPLDPLPTGRPFVEGSPTPGPSTSPSASPTPHGSPSPTPPTPTPPPTPRPSATPAPTATPRPTAPPTIAPSPPPTPTPIRTPLTPGQVIVGVGFADVSPHQLVRSATDVVYASTPTCNGYPNCYANVLPMFVATTPRRATGFFEADAAHRPHAADGTDTIGSSALAIDGNGIVWVAYNTRNEGSWITSFDTGSNRWGTPAPLGAGRSGALTQGREGVALAVDAAGNPNVVWSYVGSDNRKHVAYSVRRGGGWTSPAQIDDTPLFGGAGNIHPTMAFAPDGTLLVAWLSGNELQQYDNPDGKIYVRALRGGGWQPSTQIPDGDYRSHAGYAQVTIDQGPSMIVTGDGTVHVSYMDTTDAIRYWYSSDYVRWSGDRQPAFQRTHDPSLGPDGAGGVYIYGHGTPIGNIEGHGNDLFRLHLAAGATQWSPFAQIVSDHNVDCSVSTRWSQFFHYFPAQVDYLYWNDHKPDFDLVGQD